MNETELLKNLDLINKRLAKIERQNELIIKMLSKRPQSVEVRSEIKEARVERAIENILKGKSKKQ